MSTINVSKPPLVASLAGTGIDPTGAVDASTILAALASGTRLVVKPGETMYVNTNMTSPAELDVRSGGVVKVGTGKTFQAQIVNPGARSIMDATGTPGVLVPTNQPQWHPAWWGGVGTSDDTATWRRMDAACDALNITVSGLTGFGQTVLIPTGLNKVMNLDLTANYYHLVGSWGTTAFQPAGTPTSGYMIRLGSYTRMDGAFLFGNSRSGVTLIDTYTSNRVEVNDAFVAGLGASAIGIQTGNSSGSKTNTFNNVYGVGDGTNGTAFVSAASDTRVNNMWLGSFNIGFNCLWGGGPKVSGAHIWGCASDAMTGNVDAGVFTNLYLESNTGYGANHSSANWTVWTGCYVWRNAAGGINLTGGRQPVMTAVVFDDNTGSQLIVDGVDGFDGTGLRCASRNFKASSTAIASYGFDVTAASTNTRIHGRARNLDHLTAATRFLDLTGSIELGTFYIPLTGNTVISASTTYATLFQNGSSGATVSMTAAVGDVWEVEAVIHATSSANVQGIKTRFNGTTGTTGRIGQLGGMVASAASTTSDPGNPASSYVPSNGAGGVTSGLVTTVDSCLVQKGVIDFTGATAGTVNFQAAQNTAAGTTTIYGSGSYVKGVRRA